MEVEGRCHLFGTPLLLTLDQEKMSHRDVYKLLLESTEDCIKKEERKYSVDDMPYAVIVGNTTGTRCGQCSEKGCKGCVLPCDERGVSLTDKQQIVLHWQPETLRQVWQHSEPPLHASAERARQVKW